MRRSHRTLPLLIGAMLATAALAQVSNAAAEPVGSVTIAKGQPILIGGYSSQSGGDTSQGIDELRGAEVALSDLGGEILGHPVKLLGEDAQCTAEGGQTAATKLAGNKDILAVLGPSCSSGARAGAPILWNAGMPSIAFGATAPALTAEDRPEGFKGFLRVVPNDLLGAAFASKYAIGTLDAKSVATIHDGSPYTEQLVKAFEKNFAAAGGTVVASEAISPSDTDMRPVLTRISTKKPDLLFTPVFTSSIGFILRQKAEVPDLASMKVLGGEGVFSANVIEAAGPSIVGLEIVGPSTDLFSDRFPVFVAKFEDEYGEKPTGGFSAYGYDSMLLAAKAIEAVAKPDDAGGLVVDRKALHDAMMATKDLPALTGTLSCDRMGDCSAATYAIWKFVGDDPSSFSPGENPKRIYP